MPFCQGSVRKTPASVSLALKWGDHTGNQLKASNEAVNILGFGNDIRS